MICTDCPRRLISRSAWTKMSPAERDRATGRGEGRSAARGRCVACYAAMSRNPDRVTELRRDAGQVTALPAQERVPVCCARCGSDRVSLDSDASWRDLCRDCVDVVCDMGEGSAWAIEEVAAS